MKNPVPLSNIPIGEKCKVKTLISDGAIRRRLLDLGLVNDTMITVLQKSPSGGSVAYLIRGAVIALRNDISSGIIVDHIPY